MPSTYVFKKNAPVLIGAPKSRGLGKSHQGHILAVLKACGGLSRAALTTKLEAEDKAWLNGSKSSIKSIVDTNLTKLTKWGSVEAVKTDSTQLKERAEAVGGNHAAAKAAIKAEQKKAAAVKRAEYYLKQKAAAAELKEQMAAVEALNLALLQKNAELKDTLATKAEENTELKMQVVAQSIRLERIDYELEEANAAKVATEQKLIGQGAAHELLMEESNADLQDILRGARAAEDELKDAKATLAFVEADLMYQKVEVGMLEDELEDEKRYAASLNRETNHLNTEVTSLRFLLLLEFMLAVGAGIYFVVNYQPPVSQLQIGY